MFLSLKRTTSSPFSESIKLLPEQIRWVFKHSHHLKLAFKAAQINKIVVNGMGGSNLGAEIVRSVLRDKLKLPLLIEPGYDVPAYVDKQTLYILSSYSGTTEEVLAAYAKAKRKNAKLFIVTQESDNALTRLAERDNLSHFLFQTKANPSDQPRLGLGYAVATLLLLIRSLKLAAVTPKDIETIIKQLKRLSSGQSKNAQILAKKLAKREAILVGGPFLEGNLKTLRNQWCENAKNYASYLVLSDMNHFALEGLAKPVGNKKRLAALFFESPFYDAKISKRLGLTKEVMRKQGIATHSYVLTGETKLQQSFEMLQFGSWLTYYLALQNRVDPAAIPWVDWFKKHL